jgi:hypothetical protein
MTSTTSILVKRRVASILLVAVGERIGRKLSFIERILCFEEKHLVGWAGEDIEFE